MTFEELLARYHMTFTPMFDEEQREELETFWNQMMQNQKNGIGESDIDQILDTYSDFGILKPDNANLKVSGPDTGRLQVTAGENPAAVSMTFAAEENSGYDGSGAGDQDSPDFNASFAGQMAVSPAADIAGANSETGSSRNAQGEPVLLILSCKGVAFTQGGSVPRELNLTGIFLDPRRHRSFEAVLPEMMRSFPIVRMDMRFYRMVTWLGREQIGVILTCTLEGDLLQVTRIRAAAKDTGNSARLISDTFLSSVCERLLSASLQADEPEVPEKLMLNDMNSIEEYFGCIRDTLPANIRQWVTHNIWLTKEQNVSAEEKRHAQRALSLMAGIEWRTPYFESIDPKEAKRILDEELYGLENVKQRVIETIIQINRTHTLPSYGMLLAGPAGVGKSQIAYAVARILKLPWVALDMSTIVDPEALTGSPRIYTNAKPGRIMEAFSAAGSTSVVFVINELDKADSGSSHGSPADTLLTLLDNLGFTDNYMECALPTSGVYPIATANDKSKISDPLISRFAVIDIPNYTPEEKKKIFRDYSLPKVMRRMHMSSTECSVSDEALDVIIDRYRDYSGVRELEQAAEHLAANALYRIETAHLKHVEFTADMVRALLGESDS